jgi:hypothetical protein
MDDGAWLPAPATWWRVGLKRRGHRRGLLDMRDLGAMLDHEEPLPHPAEDQAQ